MTILDIILLSILVLLMLFFTYNIAKTLDYHMQTESIYLLPVEYEILSYYSQQGYTHISPRDFSNLTNKVVLKDGIKITGDELPDIILDKYFHLFNFIDKTYKIQDLL